MAFELSSFNVLALNLPSCALIALESRVCSPFGKVISNTYNKLNEILPNVFLACFGNCRVINQVLEALAADLPKNARSMGEIALFVQNTINRILENSRDEVNGEIDSTVRFLLLGRVPKESRHYFFTISKGAGTWMRLAKREVGPVVCSESESDAMTQFLRRRKLNEKMTEEKTVDYALECIKFIVKSTWTAGGRIQMVVMNPGDGGAVVHSWVQNNPSLSSDEYIYQGSRISGNGPMITGLPNADRDGNRAST